MKNANGDVVRAADPYFHPGVQPKGVYLRDKPGSLNNAAEIIGEVNDNEQRFHATKVASVIVGKNANFQGLAPSSSLYSGATESTGVALFKTAAQLRTLHESALLTIQNVAKQADDTVSIMNMSFSYINLDAKQLDGSEFSALGLDYLAFKRDFLPVVSRDNNAWRNPGRDVYVTAYNSLIVNSIKKRADGSYIESAFTSPQKTHGSRPLVHLAAPGEKIQVLGYSPMPNPQGKYQPSDQPQEKSGTSYSVPHVSGAIALLDQYIQKTPAVAPIAANRLVMKAVLLNSADKIEGKLVGPDGADPTKTSGMSKTIETPPGTTWRTSDAVDELEPIPADATPEEKQNIANTNQNRRNLPLDKYFGAGALNVRRAITQLNGKQQGQNAAGPPRYIAWDGSEIPKPAAGQTFSEVVYPLPTLKAGSYLSATLAFERPVAMTDAKDQGANGDYERGFKFTAKFGQDDYTAKPPNLDLYLMRDGTDDLKDAEWASTSAKSEVEHFFYQIPKGAKDQKYSLWVVNKEPNRNAGYALAWWGENPDVKGNGQGNRLEGNVWAEASADGIRGAGERGVAHVPVTLRNAAGNVVDTTESDYLGRYAFDFVEPGQYQVAFTLPRGYQFTTANAGSDDVIDSDADPLTGRTGWVTMGSSDIASVDAGLVRLPGGTVRGFAWNDANGNGVQDAGEGGLA
ncbi:MAG: S8 family serine peptidase, partial [Gemmataceae bacterium]|nr:S8 family serine peptidase [Gemmataceae bacterium]